MSRERYSCCAVAGAAAHGATPKESRNAVQSHNQLQWLEQELHHATEGGGGGAVDARLISAAKVLRMQQQEVEGFKEQSNRLSQASAGVVVVGMGGGCDAWGAGGDGDAAEGAGVAGGSDGGASW